MKTNTPESDKDAADCPLCPHRLMECEEMVSAELARKLERERDSARATMDTLREQLKADEKAAYDLRCILHEVAEYCGISTSLWPAAIAERLRQMKDDKDEIENMWEELTIAIGAQGPESDPLTGCDTNDEIHKRAMDQIKTMMSDEF